MDNSQLILKLNWFYNLELNQVDFYSEQSKLIHHDSYAKMAFGHFADIEQQHVDNIASMIKELGGNPLPIGDVVAPILGKAAGYVLSLAGTEKLLKANIMVETKASKDYKSLIDAIRHKNDEKMIKTLEANMIDEDMHIAWLNTRLQQNNNNE